LINEQGQERRILIYRVGHLGDTIIALPALWAIRRRFPHAHIALLSNSYVLGTRVSPDFVLPRDGLIDEWLTYPSDDRNGNRMNLLRLLFSVRKGKFDTLAYLAPRLRRPRDVRRDLAFFRVAGIRRVLGNSGFETLPLAENGKLPTVAHEADHLLQRLALSGVSILENGAAKIDLGLTSEEHTSANAWLRQQTPGYSIGTRLIGFGPGSKWPSKIWPEERFIEVGRRLIQERDVYPLVLGGPEDRELADRLISAWGRGASAAGVLSPRQAAAALSRCAMYVGNDTGTMHLAAAVGTPCVAIMAAQDWPGRWEPYGKGHTVLRRNVPCAGCMLKVCAAEGMRCLKEISVEEVMQACEGVLSAKSEAQRAETAFLISDSP
jgi:lipopolysaccharide heptosyltransferase III